MAEEVLAEVRDHVSQIWNVLLPIALIVLLGWGMILLSRHAIRKAEERKGDLHLSLFQNLISGAILLLCFILILSVFGGIHSVMTTLLGGTAVLTAVLAFVAQDVIKDVLAGLMLTLHKPFSVGDRIVLEDGTVGSVADITLRHVVIAGIDAQRFYIPNSKINAMLVTNYTTPEGNQSIQFRFSVGYESDMELVKRTIAAAVEQSEYTIPGRNGPDGFAAYGPVYFLAFADSALIMAVTVYYPKSTASILVIDDVNDRVRTALRENNIEIPYNYVTVVTPDQE